jgi:hypothetical protein
VSRTAHRISRRVRILANRALPGALGRLAMPPSRRRPQDSKIFCIGFNKTGTSSLHALFRREGFRSHHGPTWRNMEENLLARYDCFSDGRPDDFSELDRRYPRSQFILNVRDLDAWLGSRLDHVQRDKVSGRWKRENDHWDDTDRALQSWVALRNTYHCRVLEHFRDSPQKLLIVNFPRDPRAVEKIYDFLGLDAPPPRSPHQNASPSGDSLTHNRKRLDRLLREFGIPATEHRNDILCTSLLPEHQRDLYPSDTSMLGGDIWAK